MPNANGPHTAVSNQPEELTVVAEQPIFEGPSEGVQGSPTPFTSDGLEQVGHTRSLFDEVPAETWVAPTAPLSDIGEASASVTGRVGGC